MNYTLGLLYRKNEKAGKLLSALLFVIVAVAGLLYRIKLLNDGVDWYMYVYTNAFSNLDLFVGGILLNYITMDNSPQNCFGKTGRTVFKVISALVLASVIVIASKLYFVGESTNINVLYIYKYYFPTAFLVAVALYLIAFDHKKDYKCTKLSLHTVIKNPLRFFDYLSSVSFEFYMFHSLILSRIWMHIGTGSSMGRHFAIMGVAFVLTLLFSDIFHKAMNFKSLHTKQSAP